MKRQKNTTEDLVVENTEDGFSGLGIKYTELERSYGATNYYDYIIIEMVRIPVHYDISTIVAKCYDALKLGGKLYINNDGTAFVLDKFIIVCELFFEYIKETNGTYIFRRIDK